MARFRYAAMDSDGRETHGVVEAENQTRAISLIKERGFFPTSIDEVSPVARAGRQRVGAGEGAGLRREIRVPGFLSKLTLRRVGAKDLTVCTRQLATLIDAGVPLLRSLQILAKQEATPALTKGLLQMGESVEGGSTFAEALAQQPKIFDRFFVNMVRAGEAGGMLENVLHRLAEFLEKRERIKRKVRGAMVYPIVVLVMAVAILTFMLLKIIPQFAAVFQDMLEGAALPPVTRFVIAVSNAVVNRGLLVLAGIAALVFLVHLFGRTRYGRYKLDSLKLHAPIFGNLVSKTAIANFSRTLGTLLTSGVPILQALNIVREIVNNAVLSRAIAGLHDSVKEGESMALPMESCGVFPIMVVSMVDVGEETGALPEMLMKIADNYDEEVDAAVEALTSIIEPVMIIFLAVIVGTIVVAMFMPLVTLITKLGQ